MLVYKYSFQLFNPKKIKYRIVFYTITKLRCKDIDYKSHSVNTNNINNNDIPHYSNNKKQENYINPNINNNLNMNTDHPPNIVDNNDNKNYLSNLNYQSISTIIKTYQKELLITSSVFAILTTTKLMLMLSSFMIDNYNITTAFYYGTITGCSIATILTSCTYYLNKSFQLDPNKIINLSYNQIKLNHDLMQVLGSNSSITSSSVIYDIKSYLITNSSFTISKFKLKFSYPTIQICYVIKTNKTNLIVYASYTKQGIYIIYINIYI